MLHVHATKLALNRKNGLQNGNSITVQMVKSGLVIVPKNSQDVETRLVKAENIAMVLRGTIKNVEQWMTHVVDQISQNLHSLDVSNWAINFG